MQTLPASDSQIQVVEKYGASIRFVRTLLTDHTIPYALIKKSRTLRSMIAERAIEIYGRLLSLALVKHFVTKRLLIVYFSEKGTTERMAKKISNGAKGLGVMVELKRVEDCKLSDLVEADGIVVGSPTYFSNVAWQVKKLIDESIELYNKDHALKGKIGGCFTSAGTSRDGKECIRLLELTLRLHHRMKIISGVIRASGDKEALMSDKCRKYGEEIARQILSKNTTPTRASQAQRPRLII